MTDKQPSSFDVSMAIQAIEHFFKKYGAKFDTTVAVAFAVALARGEDLELTPCEEKFRRVMITNRRTRIHKDRVALVFGYDDFDAQKTEELNELINRFTKKAFVAD